MTHKHIGSGQGPSGTFDLIAALRSAIRAFGTQMEVAGAAGVDRSIIQKFMRRTRGMSLENASKVAFALGYELKKSAESDLRQFLAIQAGAEMVAGHVNGSTLGLQALGTSPVPAFCTELDTGRFAFINRSFAKLFGFKSPGDMLAVHTDATTLYRDKTDRRRWVSFVVESTRGRDGYSPATIIDLIDRNGMKRISVAEIAKLLTIEDVRYALGFAIDVTELRCMHEAIVNRGDALWQVLNNTELNLGAFTASVADDKLLVERMNNRAICLLGLNDTWWEQVGEISASLMGHIGEAAAKLSGEAELSSDRFCTFKGFSDKRTSVSIPVVLNEYGVRDPAAQIGPATHQSRKLCEFVSAFRDASIPEDIVQLFEIYGPRNPTLEKAGIQTLIKERTEGTDGSPEFIFRFANRLVKDQLVRRGLLHDRINRPAVEGKVYDADGIESIDGKRDIELFAEFAHKYRESDEFVCGSGRSLQQIEEHPIVRASVTTDVHVIKFPQRDGAGQVNGVEVFYWEAKKDNDVFDALRSAYRPWAFLDDIPVPVYRKDGQLRFIYANKAYICDMMSTALITVGDVRDIIGLTDEQIHKPDDAELYERDDRELLKGPRRIIERIERHGEDWVKVVKTAVPACGRFRTSADHTADSEIAIQGVFWRLDLEEMRQFLLLADR